MITLPQRLELLAFELGLENWPLEDRVLLYEVAHQLRHTAKQPPTIPVVLTVYATL
jgi:hypothetical protein